MASTNYIGVYKTNEGYWAYRYSIVVNGQRKDVKKAKDANGQRFKSAKAAAKARAEAISNNALPVSPAISRKTLGDVYLEYCEKGRTGKAFEGLLKRYFGK